MQDYYYGLPQQLWDDLACSAEEYLEETICSSAHILGLYPYGPRLCGLESESPGLLCLYSDSSIDRLLSPFVRDKYIAPSYVTLKLDGSFVYYVEFWSWLYELNTRSDFMHIVPCYGDFFHQDSSIESIISLSLELLPSILRRNCCWAEESLSPTVAYDLRTSLVFILEKTFCPCVNKEWGAIHELSNLPNEIELIDSKILRQENLTQEELANYRNYVYAVIDTKRFADDFFRKQNKLSEEVIKYLRFQL